jgi:hypothetical protein
VEGLDRTYVIARADYLGEPVLIEFGRLRLPPARRDVFGGDGNGLEAGFGDSQRRGGRAQGFEADLLQGPLELDAILRGALAGLEFVQDGFGAVDEAFVVDDRGVEGRDEFEKVGLAFEEVGEEIGILGQGTELVGSGCLASSSRLSAQRGSRFMNISRRGGAGRARRDATHREIAVARLLAGCWKFKMGCRKDCFNVLKFQMKAN